MKRICAMSICVSGLRAEVSQGRVPTSIKTLQYGYILTRASRTLTMMKLKDSSDSQAAVLCSERSEIRFHLRLDPMSAASKAGAFLRFPAVVKRIHFPSIGSTNTWCRENTGDFDQTQLTLVTADHQTAGEKPAAFSTLSRPFCCSSCSDTCVYIPPRTQGKGKDQAGYGMMRRVGAY